MAEILVIVRRVRLEIPQLFGGSVFRPKAESRERAVVSPLERAGFTRSGKQNLSSSESCQDELPFIHSFVFSLRGRAGRNQSPVM